MTNLTIPKPGSRTPLATKARDRPSDIVTAFAQPLHSLAAANSPLLVYLRVRFCRMRPKTAEKAEHGRPRRSAKSDVRKT